MKPVTMATVPPIRRNHVLRCTSRHPVFSKIPHVWYSICSFVRIRAEIQGVPNSSIWYTREGHVRSIIVSMNSTHSGNTVNCGCCHSSGRWTNLTRSSTLSVFGSGIVTGQDRMKRGTVRAPSSNKIECIRRIWMQRSAYQNELHSHTEKNDSNPIFKHICRAPSL